MTEPLVRAAFDFTFADRIDATVRSAQHLPSIRAQHRQSTMLSGVLAALLMVVLLWGMAPPDWPTPAMGAAVVLVGLLAAGLRHWRYPRLYRTAVARMLHDMHGEGTAHCEVEVHTDRLLFRQPEAVIVFPWTDVQAMHEDKGDLVFLTRRGAAVVRGRAFANASERAAFVRCVRGLCPSVG